MNRFSKFLMGATLVITLISFSVVPALAGTGRHSNRQNNYASDYRYYSPGSYNTRYGAIPIYWPISAPNRGTRPLPTRPTPSPAPNPNPAPTPAPSPAPSNPSNPSTGLAAEETQMVNLVNQERINRGIRALSVNETLVTIARLKSADMVKNNYFDHNSPTYGSPFDMMKKYGVTYKTAGENIAGNSSTAAAHQALMNSEGHRDNILNPNFNQIGIGIASGSVYGNIYSQEFIGN